MKERIQGLRKVCKKYYASYLRTILVENFQIHSFETFDIGTGTEVGIFHSIILRKK